MAKVNKKLLDEIDVYCRINEIADPDKFVTDLVEKAFSVMKYGNKPDIEIKPKQVEVKEEITKEEPIIKVENDTIVVKNNIKDNDNYDNIYDI